MRLLTFVCFMLICFNAYAQDCKDPNLRATFRDKYQELGISSPDFLENATVIINPSPSYKIKWVGLYWEGPVGGAILAYDCKGELLSVQQTGGIKSIEFFNITRNAGPAISVEEISMGTGSYLIKRVSYILTEGKILKIMDHTALERNFVVPSEDGITDSFEFLPSGPANEGNKKIVVEGVRKVYPAKSSEPKTFRVEKLPSEAYCWDIGKREYHSCR